MTKKTPSRAFQVAQRLDEVPELLDGAVDEVARDDDHVRGQRVRLADDGLDELVPDRGPHVHVAHLDDAVARGAGRKLRQGHLDARDLEAAHDVRHSADADGGRGAAHSRADDAGEPAPPVGIFRQRAGDGREPA